MGGGKEGVWGSGLSGKWNNLEGLDGPRRFLGVLGTFFWWVVVGVEIELGSVFWWWW